jgi:hypothetical protein
VEWWTFCHDIFGEESNLSPEKIGIWNWRIKKTRILLFAVTSISAWMRQIGDPWVPSSKVEIGEMGAIFPFYFHEKRQLS